MYPPKIVIPTEAYPATSPVFLGRCSSWRIRVAGVGAGAADAGVVGGVGVAAVQREVRQGLVPLRQQPPAKPGGARMAQEAKLVPDSSARDLYLRGSSNSIPDDVVRH